MTARRALPYGRQAIDQDDIARVVAVLQSDMLTTGPRVEEFEQAFAKATGAGHAVACNSGTAALHLAALALDLGPARGAIVPAMTFVATANVARMAGARVTFADVDPDTGLMTAATLREAFARAAAEGNSVKAAFPVHLNGQLCDMPALADAAASLGIELIEDACHALGVKDVGANKHSKIACFSTHPVKPITTGEGGVVTTQDALMAERMRRLRSHGLTREPGDFRNAALAFDSGDTNPWYYEMHEVGWNYRLPDILCALGISQLAKLDRFHRRRCELAARYDEFLAPLAPMVRPVPHGARPHGWHLYAVLIDFGALKVTRAAVMKALSTKNIHTQVHYIPVHRQPYYRSIDPKLDLPGADAYYARCLSVPLFPAMTDDDVAHVVLSIKSACGLA